MAENDQFSMAFYNGQSYKEYISDHGIVKS